MIVYPAIDLMGGRCVRLAKGKFDQATIYPDHPAEALARFADRGATWAHLVDLDGARGGRPAQHSLLAALAASSPVQLQVAGGFRTRDQVARMLDFGASRIVVGSLAVEQPQVAGGLFDEFGSEAIALALDVSLEGDEPMVAHRGWTKLSKRSLLEVAGDFPTAKHILVTDIARDGMRSGANQPLMRRLASELPGRQLQASGGFARLEEIQPLASVGVAGVIIGKAMWEGQVDLREAISRAGG